MTVKLRDINDVRAIEATPLAERGAAPNIFALLSRAAGQFGRRTALSYLRAADAESPVEEISYQDLLAKATQCANALHSLGVGPEDAVALLIPNLPQTHYALWGTTFTGIVQPLNPLLSDNHLADLLNSTQTRVLITLGPSPRFDIWDKARALLTQVPSVTTVLSVDIDNLSDSERPSHIGSVDHWDFDTLLAQQPHQQLLSRRQLNSQTVAAYFHTGGTTGKPSIAPLSHGNISHMATMMSLMFGLTENDVLLCGLPLFHVNAIFLTGVAPFQSGASVLLATPEGYRNKDLLPNFWRIIERHRVSFFSGVPTIYSALLSQPTDGCDLSSLRYGLCGAAPMPAAQIAEFENKTGLRILEGYGMTEGSCASTGNPRDGVRKPGSIGIPMPYTRVKVAQIDSEGNWQRDCGVNEVGSILIKGPNLFRGYLDHRKNRGRWTADGWFDTGDMGRFDVDGYWSQQGFDHPWRPQYRPSTH